MVKDATHEAVPILRADYEALIEALRKARQALAAINYWLDDDRLGQWPYMEGGYFYADKQKHSDDLRRERTAIDVVLAKVAAP